MADVAPPSPAATKPAAGLAVQTPNRISPTPSRSSQTNRHHNLTLDTLASPVTQNGSFEFDRIIKSGEVWKRTRKTKVGKCRST
jgi:hypothetical protein